MSFKTKFFIFFFIIYLISTNKLFHISDLSFLEMLNMYFKFTLEFSWELINSILDFIGIGDFFRTILESIKNFLFY